MFSDPGDKMGTVLSTPQKRIKIATKQIKNKEIDVFTKKSIIYLYMCRDNIIEIDRNIRALENLRVLQICCNKITHLPKEIGRLRNLNILFLSRNNLVEIPDEISFLKNLSDLNLSDNNLTNLPASLENLKNLKLLDISGNPMKELPKVVSKIEFLSSLSILRTQIKYLSPSLLHLSHLIELNYKEKEKMNVIIKRNEIKLLHLVSEYAIKHKKYIKRFLPIGTLKEIAMFIECDICGKQIYNPIYIYTSIEIADSIASIKYSICHTHDIDFSSPYSSICKSFFIEEYSDVNNSQKIALKDNSLVNILEVDKIVKEYTKLE